MKREPKIAIYMPCYNHAKYVGQAIECIINQTYPNWELFIVNDGSTDNSAEVISSYVDERIHYFDFKENTKMVGAVNFMLRLIKEGDYDYVHGMASDDYIDEDKLRRQIAFLEEHPQYKVCFTWDKVVFDNGNPYNEEYSHKSNQNRFDWLYDFLKNENCMNANSVLIEKDLYFELGGMNEYFIQTGDYKLWFEIVTKYPIYIIKDELTYYRRHETNLSNITIERLIRSANENTYFFRKIIYALNKDEFVRAYYRSLPYKNINNDSELWAAKFFLLAGLRESKADAIALDIYYEHCTDDIFIDTLKNKYFFSHQAFYNYSGFAGGGWMLDEIYNLGIKREDKPVLRPAVVLMDIIDSGRLNGEMLTDIISSTFVDTYLMQMSNSEFEGYYDKLKKAIGTIRKQYWETQKKKNCLVIIADDSKWELPEDFADQIGVDKCFISFVKNEEAEVLCQKVDYHAKMIPSNSEVVELFNYDELRSEWIDDMVKDLSQIYYVDCLWNEYQCAKLAYSLPLSCSQNAIIEMEKYNSRLNDFPVTACLLDDIIGY